MFSETTLLIYLAFSSIGFGYFVYGKKQKKLAPMLAGISLMGYQYFLSGVFPLVGVGLAIMLTPMLFRE